MIDPRKFPVPQPVINLRCASNWRYSNDRSWKSCGSKNAWEAGLTLSFIEDIEALIFDMDGVIVDSEPLHLRAYQEYFAAVGIDYSNKTNQEFLGMKDIFMAQELIQRYSLSDTPVEFVSKKERILMRLVKEEGQARPGVLRLLEQAASLGLPMSIASSATMPTIQLVVDHLGIRHYFQYLTSGDEVKNGKPAPDVFLLAAERMGAKPSSCLVIEDTLNGLKAAKAAGMKCLSVPCAETRHEDHSLADMRMFSLEELHLAPQSNSTNPMVKALNAGAGV